MERRPILAEDKGQASIEAAFVLPVVLMLIALLCQPACVLYTKAVMQSAAAEGCRLLTTAKAVRAGDGEYRDYILRRLSAVPNIDVFHQGGNEGWTIEFSGSSSSHEATVRIATTVRPLPLVGALVGAFATHGVDGGIVIDVSVTTATRPQWLEGDYAEWTGMWA